MVLLLFLYMWPDMPTWTLPVEVEVGETCTACPLQLFDPLTPDGLAGTYLPAPDGAAPFQLLSPISSMM